MVVGGQSITGGFFYRGNAIPSLDGKYVYADFTQGTVWALEYDGINPTVNTLLFDTAFEIVTFGQSTEDEVFFVAFNEGKIYKLTPWPTGIKDGRAPSLAGQLEQNIPNPFNPTTSIGFMVTHVASVELVIYDVRGARIATIADETFSPGDYARTWNGRADNAAAAPSGVYYYRLIVDGVVVDSRRMVLLK